MGKGRKKLPDAVKALRGTDQPCRTGGGAEVATTVTSLPKCGLKGTAKRVFALVASELIEKKLLDVLGVDLVIAYAREMALYHDTMKELETEKLVVEVTTKFGVTKIVNPKRKVAESALANARTLAVEFGMTPASRSRVAMLLAEPEQKDDFADFEELPR